MNNISSLLRFCVVCCTVRSSQADRSKFTEVGYRSKGYSRKKTSDPLADALFYWRKRFKPVGFKKRYTSRRWTVVAV